MEVKKYDNRINYELFSQNCIDGVEIINVNNLKNTVTSLVSSLGWDTIVYEWAIFLKKEIKDRKAAFNFATWLYIYDFGKCSLKDPYPFLALLYKKLELDKKINDENWLIKDGSLQYNPHFSNLTKEQHATMKSNYQNVVGVSKSFNPDLLTNFEKKKIYCIIYLGNNLGR